MGQQVPQLDGQRLLDRPQAPVAVKIELRGQTALKVQSATDSSKAQRAAQERQIQVVADRKRREIELYIAAGSDALVKQETDVDA